MKCYITGYAMHTIAGTEESFELAGTKGFTGTTEIRDWSRCVDTCNSGDELYDEIKKVINRALQMRNLISNEKKRFSLVIGSNFFENRFWEQNVDSIASKHNFYITEKLVEEYKIEGMVVSNSTACSSGGSAIVSAYQILEDNKSDAIIVLGYDIESSIPKNGMKRIGALSKEQISPFSAGRTGTKIGDGIAVLIIEGHESESRKNHQNENDEPLEEGLQMDRSKIEIAGFGVSCDAYNVTSPEPHGYALEYAMRSAIEMAKINYNEVGYINTHGSGTIINDKLETQVVKRIFKEYAYDLLLNSTKSILGHTLGAAGIVEAVVTIMQMKESLFHPTVHYKGRDSDCDLNYCFEGAVKKNIKYAMSNSIGFGGINVCILFGGGEWE